MLPAEIAAELNQLLGAKLTAAVGGVDNTRMVHNWINGKNQPSCLDALSTALKAARILADVDGARVAQRWFVGTNTYLKHRSPLELLAEGKPDGRTAVLRAASAFVIQ